MAYRIFNIPVSQPEPALSELNRFLASHQVVDVDRQFYTTGSLAFWSFCVQFISSNRRNRGHGKGAFSKIDYKEVLTPEEFGVFAKLRELRKQIASELSMPVFAIFTNEQLAEMVRSRVDTITKLKEINGIGEKKAESFGQRFLTALGESRSE